MEHCYRYAWYVFLCSYNWLSGILSTKIFINIGKSAVQQLTVTTENTQYQWSASQRLPLQCMVIFHI